METVLNRIEDTSYGKHGRFVLEKDHRILIELLPWVEIFIFGEWRRVQVTFVYPIGWSFADENGDMIGPAIGTKIRIS